MGKNKLPTIFIIIIIGLIMQSALTPNFFISILAYLFLPLAYKSIWRQGEPNPLFFGIAMQWLVCCIELVYCNFRGITLSEKFIEQGNVGVPELLNITVILSLYGLLFFTLGLHIGIKKLKLITPIPNQNLNISIKNLLIIYIVYYLVINLLGKYIWAFPGLSQILLVFINFRWGLFFVLYYLCFKRNKYIILINLLLVFDIIQSSASFFASSFLNVLLVAIMCVLALNKRFNLQTQIIGGILILFTINTAIIWSAVKTDYRNFVSQGYTTQNVVVSKNEARNYLFNLIQNIDKNQYKKGIEITINRIGYIGYFSQTLAYVPYNVDFQYGKIYLNAVKFFLMPRLIFPNKPSIDDSEHVREFTGLFVSGRESATSISLGYMADAYIDFGPILMIIPIFLLGLCFGLSYTYFYNNAPSTIWRWIYTVPYIFMININGMNANKAVGVLIINFVVLWIFNKFLVKRINLILKW
ncbi:MAG TPA: hypothetical protein VIH57_08695 [Bacteroidales bacterium]